MSDSVVTKTEFGLSRWSAGLRWLFEALYKFSGRKAEIEISNRILALQDLSDAELAEMGIERDRINHYVVEEFLKL